MITTQFETELKTHLGKFNTSPYLFIGSGLSRRYLNLPTWNVLLEEFSKTLELPFEFGYYSSQVEGDLPRLASILADEFHEIWWTSDTFSKNRTDYNKEAQKSRQQPFKIQLALYVKQTEKLNDDYFDEIEQLKKVIIDGIITTNWDEFTKMLFDDFDTYIGQYQLLFSDNTSIGEIYKIHGSIESPETLIVTKEDYVTFQKKNQFLAAKLFTIFAEHPIIFLGYSLSDINIINILSSIVECVDSVSIEKLKDRLIFIEWDKDTVIPQISDGHIIVEKFAIPIKQIRINSFIPLYDVLSTLKQRLPIKILKKCRAALYELIHTEKSTSTILVGDIENVKVSNDIEFVIGVGVARQYSEHGYIGISNDDIFEDVVKDDKPWKSEIVIKHVIPKLFKGNVYLPIYKYLRQGR